MNRVVKFGLVPLVALAVVAAAVIGILALTKEEPKEPVLGAKGGEPSTSLPAPPASANEPLAPAKEITIGKNRVLSACRLLPRESLEELFGSLPSDARVYETYTDTTLPNPRDDASSVHNSCDYYGDWGFSMRVRQSVSAPTSGQEMVERLGVDQEAAHEALAAFREIDVSEDPAAAALLAELEASNEIFERPRNATVAQVDGLVVAEFGDRSGGTRDFSMISGNRIITMSYESEVAPDDAAILSQFARARAIVLTNAADPDFSQAPAPSFGASNKFGKTTLLEPCAIFSPEVFAKITWAAPNGQVEREPLPLALPAPNSSLGEWGVEASCDRSFDGFSVPDSTKLTQGEQRYGRRGGVRVSFDLVSFPDAASAQEDIEYYLEDEDSTPLKTDADAAAVRWTGSSYVLHMRTGPYVVSMRVRGDTYRDGEYVDVNLTQSQFRDAANLLVSQIKGQA